MRTYWEHQHPQALWPAKKNEAEFIWVVVKIMVPLLGPLNTRCRTILRDPGRDHHFGNLPIYRTLQDAVQIMTPQPSQ